MLVTCILLGVDSSNPDTDEYVGSNQSDDSIADDKLRQEIKDDRNYRYSVICTVGICVCVCVCVMNCVHRIVSLSFVCGF